MKRRWVDVLDKVLTIIAVIVSVLVTLFGVLALWRKIK
jgi:hypothetical protein